MQANVTVRVVVRLQQPSTTDRSAHRIRQSPLCSFPGTPAWATDKPQILLPPIRERLTLSGIWGASILSLAKTTQETSPWKLPREYGIHIDLPVSLGALRILKTKSLTDYQAYKDPSQRQSGQEGVCKGRGSNGPFTHATRSYRQAIDSS